MCKSSVDYSELFGLRIALSDLSYKTEHTVEENTVKRWLEQRIKFLEQK
jgi:hypothetical protein